MRLLHYPRAEEFVFDPSQTYEQREDMKPRGFWVSVDGECSWKEWCESEGFAISTLHREFEVTVSPSAKILMLEDSDAIRNLGNMYPTFGTMSGWHIDWRRAAKDYQGILITPYQWDCRMSVDWYYPWDCASGCIWDLSVIESVKPLRCEVSA